MEGRISVFMQVLSQAYGEHLELGGWESLWMSSWHLNPHPVSVRRQFKDCSL